MSMHSTDIWFDFDGQKCGYYDNTGKNFRNGSGNTTEQMRSSNEIFKAFSTYES